MPYNAMVGLYLNDLQQLRMLARVPIISAYDPSRESMLAYASPSNRIAIMITSLVIDCLGTNNFLVTKSSLLKLTQLCLHLNSPQFLFTRSLFPYANNLLTRVCASVTHATHHKQIINILQTLQRESLTLARHGGHNRTAPIIKHATQTNHSNSSITDRTTKIYSDIIGWQHIIG